MTVKLLMPQFQRKVSFFKRFIASLAWSALAGGTGGTGEVRAGMRYKWVILICPYKSAVRAIPIPMKPTPGAILGVRAWFPDEDEKHPHGDEHHPGGTAGHLCSGSFEPLNHIFGKCMDLPQIKYPGTWKVSVPFPLGYIGHAGCVITTMRFVGCHPTNSTRVRTTLPNLCLGRKPAPQKD